MDSDIIQVERDNRVAVITLNRPERLNAISRETIRAVMSAMDELENDETVAVGQPLIPRVDLELSAHTHINWKTDI
tara:strand:- start:154 stop:381 length:228 start_codon:yes stop_codon:yes gene_type:complete